MNKYIVKIIITDNVEKHITNGSLLGFIGLDKQ